MEHNRAASDGTTYNNGYGICMIPKTYVTTSVWNDSKTLIGAYKSSTINTSILVTLSNNLKNVLGTHLVNRNVLLSSSVDGDYHSNAYIWTTSYATLMSVGQLTGTFASNRNKYDDGEANYKLPLFNYTSYTIGSQFWSRGIWGHDAIYDCYVFVSGINVFNNDFINVTKAYGVRPLIYLR